MVENQKGMWIKENLGLNIKPQLLTPKNKMVWLNVPTVPLLERLDVCFSFQDWIKNFGTKALSQNTPEEIWTNDTLIHLRIFLCKAIVSVTAFLQVDLNEDEYVVQPKEFLFSESPMKVCRLKEAIYGLEQASREWNKKLDLVLKNAGFEQSRLDPCVYHNISGNKMIFITVYDLLIFSNNEEPFEKSTE